MLILNLNKIRIIAKAEGRLTRRLTRYWVFLVISYLLGILVFLYYSAVHSFVSPQSASIGVINPRYLIIGPGLMYLIGYSIGIVFLGYDIRARDVREIIAEVLDSRPVTNLELVCGRFLGLFLCSIVPLIILILFLQLLGWLLPLMGSPLGRTIEPISIITFIFYLAIPSIAFSLAVVFLVTLLVRNRILSAVVSIAALAGLVYAVMTVPPYYVPYLDFLGFSAMSFPSDLLVTIANPGGWLQRAGLLILSLGLLGTAAAIHPRLDGGSSIYRTGSALIVALLGLILLTGAAQVRKGIGDELEQWLQAHKARINEPVSDVQAISGTIFIDPGKELKASLLIRIRAPAGHNLEHVLFTLNPGLEVARVMSADGGLLQTDHKNGLLEIELDRVLMPGESTALEMEYGGFPDMKFAYLDSAIKFSEIKQMDANIALLGYINGFFDKRFVALMPGIRWLPVSGADVERDDTRKRGKDFFNIDLVVELPSGWTIAGPGKRIELDSDVKHARVRYKPGVSIPEVALIASRFRSFSTDINGITFEALVHPDHDSNFETLAHTRDEVEKRIRDFLEIAEDAGLEYPFGAFTMVEVPLSLRGFEGGWRLDTSMSPPAMLLVKENGFPAARFDFDAEKAFDSDEVDTSISDAEWDTRRLIRFFSNDVTGGNLFQSMARSFFVHRTSAAGPDAIALNFAMEQLATELLSGKRSYFSAHLFTSLQTNMPRILMGAAERAGTEGLSGAFVSALTAKPDVWDSALNIPLIDIDPWDDPQRAIDVLTLKGGGMAETIYDVMGPRSTGKILANLLRLHAGGSYTREDVIAAAADVDEDLGPLLNAWFTSTELPGFIADNVRLYQLPDNDNGDRAYQFLVRVRNEKPVTGFARVTWYFEAFGDENSSDPIRIDGESAIEFGVVTSKPPVSTHLEPYLSLNRENFNIKILNREEIQKKDLEPFNGVRKIAYDEIKESKIYADDLDEGFKIVKDDDIEESFRLRGRSMDIGTDNGLPVGIGPIAPAEWSRRITVLSWGRYRHTAAYIRAGDGGSRAVMPATLPAAGTWQLELYIPWFNFIRTSQQRGTWNLDIVSDYGRETVAFDATVGDYGWNLVGEFDLPAGEVRVEFSDKTNGRVVMADAIAWSPIRIQSVSKN